MTAPVPVALLTYTVKPRGGVVHTLALAEALHDAGYPVRVFALGDPAAGVLPAGPRSVHPVPSLLALPTLEERVFASVAALADGLAGRSAPIRSCTRRTASPPGPPAASATVLSTRGTGSAWAPRHQDRPPRRRLHQRVAHRVPAAGHRRARPDPGGQRALAGSDAGPVRGQGGGGAQRRRRGPVPVAPTQAWSRGCARPCARRAVS